MIELILKLGKDVHLNEEYMKLLDVSNEGYNLFIMSIPENKLAEIEAVISHYIKKQTN